MMIGSVLGVLFVSLVRRVLVEDPELPFPESVAASQIHKAGQMGAQAAKYLFYNMAFGARFSSPAHSTFSRPTRIGSFRWDSWARARCASGAPGTTNVLATGGSPCSPGRRSARRISAWATSSDRVLASLNFSGTIIAWGLLIPLLMYFLGPQLHAFMPANAGDESWIARPTCVWRYIVRPVAVGGMLSGAAYTLFKMRKSLGVGLARAFKELKAGAAPPETNGAHRTVHEFACRAARHLRVCSRVMIVLYTYLSGGIVPAVVAAVVMLIVGFCFATVSGYLVGVIGSSNNPISGLTLSTRDYRGAADGRAGRVGDRAA